MLGLVRVLPRQEVRSGATEVLAGAHRLRISLPLNEHRNSVWLRVSLRVTPVGGYPNAVSVRRLLEVDVQSWSLAPAVLPHL